MNLMPEGGLEDHRRVQFVGVDDEPLNQPLQQNQIAIKRDNLTRILTMRTVNDEILEQAAAQAEQADMGQESELVVLSWQEI